MRKIASIVIAVALLAAFASCSKKDPFETSIYSEQPTIVTFQDYLSENPDLPSEGVDPVLAFGAEKGIIEKKGFQFKDSNGNGELDPYEDWRLSPRERAVNLVSLLPVEEKLALLDYPLNKINAFDDGFAIPGLYDDGTYKEDSAAERIVEWGHRYENTKMNNIAPLDLSKFLNNIQGLSERLDYGIPYFFSKAPEFSLWTGNELDPSQETGWPFWIGFGAIDDLHVTKQFGETVRQEMIMSGRHGVVGPQLDLATEPRWARIAYTFHSDPEMVSKHATAFIQGMQGDKLDKNDIAVNGVVSFVKHFPGTGSCEQGMDNHTYAGRYSVFPGDNFDAHLQPFKDVFQNAKPGGVMIAYSIYDIEKYKDVENGAPVDEAASFSTKIVKGLLGEELGFDGAIVSDSGVVKTEAWGHEDETEAERLAAMVNAGTYQYMPGADEGWRMEAYEKGLISDEVIDDAVVHSLVLQFETGLFENPYVNIAEAEKFWDPNGKERQKRNELGYEAMKKAMVMVKNDELNADNNVLPVRAGYDPYIETVDINGNGKVDVYFDSAFPDSDSGQAKTYAKATEEKFSYVNFVSDINEADVAVVRINARGGTYFGTQGPVPLDFESPTLVYDREAKKFTDEVVENFTDLKNFTFGDWSNVGGPEMIKQGYRAYLSYSDSIAAINKALAAKAARPEMKLVVGMTAPRPGIVSSFIDDVDGMYIDFAATDSAFLDVLFWWDGAKPEGSLPVEFPRDNESVNAQLEDVPGDTENPLFEVGFGLEYTKVSGYGY